MNCPHCNYDGKDPKKGKFFRGEILKRTLSLYAIVPGKDYDTSHNPNLIPTQAQVCGCPSCNKTFIDF